MAGDPITQDASVQAALAGIRIFSGLPPAALDMLAARVERLSLQAGAVLFRERDPSSDLYVVQSGALSVTRTSASGAYERIGTIYGGETVGEMAMLTGEPRSATVTALRDCELCRIARALLDELIAAHPQIALGIAGVLAQRLARVQQPARETGKPRVFLFSSAGNVSAAAARAFVERLGVHASAAARICIIAEPWTDGWREKLQAVESAHDYVFLVPGDAAAEWRDYCHRQADIHMLLASAEADPPQFVQPEPGAETELVLLAQAQPPPGRSARWMAATAARCVHHVRDETDMARLARMLTRTALAIVLSGGGARSFAHLGVLQALREAGIAPDIYGGASMGAVIAAAFAAGFPPDVVERDMRKVFVEQRPMSDPTFPVVSFFRGRKIARLLDMAFGERCIEDLRLPFFCLSSDIGNAEAVVHRSGSLQRWLQASVAIPGVFPPVLDQGRVLVDGGVIDNLPIDAALAMQRGRVIGVDVSGDDGPFAPPLDQTIPWWQRATGARRPGEPAIVETLWRVGTIGSVSALRRGARAAHLVIKPPVSRVPLLDWKRFDATVALGAAHTRGLIAAQPALFESLRNALR